jgi:L-ascorbate 6-phosphate lactonase
VTVWLLGNAGVLVVDSRGRRIAIDPWTSDWLEIRSAANPEPVVRQRPARLASEELADLVDAVLVTHEHPDHLDPGLVHALTAAGVPVFLPRGCVPAAEACGYPSSALRPIDVGEQVDVCGFDLEAVPAAHAFAGDGYGRYTNWLDEAGAHRAVRFPTRPRSSRSQSRPLMGRRQVSTSAVRSRSCSPRHMTVSPPWKSTRPPQRTMNPTAR